MTFRSENTGSADTSWRRKGHVMFMHSGDVDVRYAAFDEMGRTRKDLDVSNAFDAAVPLNTNSNPTLSNLNPRGRYAVHFHRTGKRDLSVKPALVRGCTTTEATSWAFVNHDSYVDFEDNIAYKSFGAAFLTENGAEIGAFRRNLAAHVDGRPGGGPRGGEGNHDLAQFGSGFWLQSTNVAVEDNVSTGAIQGYNFFQRSKKTEEFDFNAQPNQRIPKEALLKPEAAAGRGYVRSSWMPIMRFKGNTAVASFQGMFNVDSERNFTAPTDSFFEDFLTYNHNEEGIVHEYYRNLTLKNVQVIRDSGVWAADEFEHGMRLFNSVDVFFPWQVRSTDRHDGVFIRGHSTGVTNDGGDAANSEGPTDKAQHEVIDSSLDFVGTSGGNPFSDMGSDGSPLMPMQRSVARSDLPARPAFSPQAGTFTGSQTVHIGVESGTTVYYKLGSFDTGQSGDQIGLEHDFKPGSWTQYDPQNPITISASSKLIAIAYKGAVSAGNRSRIRTGIYIIDSGAQQVATPSFSPTPGTYTGTQPVSLASATAGAAIWYTTDGTAPHFANGKRYTGPIDVSATTTVKAFAYKGSVTQVAGMVDSATATGTYTIGGTPPPSDIVEAEDAAVTRSGVAVDTDYPGYSGTGYGDYNSNPGSYIQWPVSVSTAGTYELRFRYALMTGDRPLEIKVNGSVVNASLSFPATGAWNDWETVTTTATLAAGSNTVRATSIGTGPNVDRLEYELVSGGPSPITVQAEDYTAAQAGTGSFTSLSWQATTTPSGFLGSGAMRVPDVGTPEQSTLGALDGPRLDYAINFPAAGTYYLHVRMAGPGTDDNSIHVGLLGGATTAGGSGVGVAYSPFAWVWQKTPSGSTTPMTVTISSAGTHTFSVWMREDGVAVDALYFTTDPAGTP